ncbi:DUF3040 domain-containing protein [Paenarthrobacter ureafaciens]|nr:DUF3040 domain-containing protein [Paenarthrobacter sp. PAE-2]MCW3767737.1 DUF3040 domain-containing protein [Paenarthrobacter sp. PAE-2]
MQLSDRERNILEGLESQLMAEDPELARKLASGFDRQRLPAEGFIGSFALMIGLVVLMTGVAAHMTVVGVGGFLLMGTGSYLLVRTCFDAGGRWSGRGRVRG